jgi:peptide/nickel transport system permease protein
MGAFIIRRLLQSIIVLIVASIIVFLLMRLVPGDPLQLYIVRNQLEGLTPEEQQELRVEFGLDKPLPAQYSNWLTHLLRGDFGRSVFYSAEVWDLIKERLPVTLHLGILALIFSSFFGILMGLISALRRGSWMDNISTSLANLGISIPAFWLGVLMAYLLSLTLGWLPVQGYTSPLQDFWLSTKQVIMPVICLSVVPLASNARQTRSSMLEIIRQDYVRTAWSKGLRERAVIFRHIIKNGFIPIVTLIGLQVTHIIGGSVLIETVFNIPGMGRLIVEAVFDKDYVIVQGCCVLIATIVTLSNLFIDISYGWLDPRIRYE